MDPLADRLDVVGIGSAARNRGIHDGDLRSGFDQPNAKVFASHTLALAGVERWRAAGGDGVAEQPVKAAPSDRVWQSRQHGGLKPEGFRCSPP